MPLRLTADDIRKRFETSREFNEIFDAFDQAIRMRLADLELYRRLFWNHTLTPNELCLFGEKLVREFPAMMYDVYMWLANIFETTYSVYDNYELALSYYKKAAASQPTSPEPYISAANCYEPDLNIPPVASLIDFLKNGVRSVPQPQPLHLRLADLYDISGNDEMSMYFRRKAGEGPPHISPDQPPRQ